MSIATVNVIPMGTATPSVGDYVADCIRTLKGAGADFEITAMGTIINGDTGDILDLVRKIHEAPFQKGVLRVVTTVTIDDRRDREVTSGDKVASVLKRVGETGE